jgi:hypothetical protein
MGKNASTIEWIIDLTQLVEGNAYDNGLPLAC